ncbi:helix-turn-helix transcriptional regulator [Kutzneria buriramensis]|uniref:AraC-like DNA-binding protein n=1 Tax=Kutzneria buriramensis TaxID=1045776 RepID=A0A3E0HB21_9PSEU|nr:helix-turn-helix transcriptional regulator [Kutzneria buriramensis]REH41088.1 AraC-like DNA-binding protein [Kutzneria buriramensis]
MYREWATGLAGAVAWSRVVDEPEAHRILPDGCLDLIWSDGRLIVAGPDTIAHEMTSPAGRVYAGLRFMPGTGPSVLGVPAHELRDSRVRLDEIWPQRLVDQLTARVGAAPNRAAALVDIARSRIEVDPVTAAVVTGLRAGRPVAMVADEVGLSERQLLRRSLAAFGYGPKTLARVLRVERALALATHGVPAADIAARVGCADQAHLSREVKALTGVPLTKFRISVRPTVDRAPGRRRTYAR